MLAPSASPAPHPHATPRFLPLLLLLFVGSGGAALIYEIVWFQLLQLVIGSSAVSIAVLLGTFMGGMCLGSYVLPRYIDRRAVDILQPDAAQIGVTQFRDVARACEQTGILVVPHSPWSALVVAAHLNVLLGVGNAPMIEYPAPSLLEGPRGRITRLAHQRIIEHPLELRDGYLELPDRPGLGLGDFVPEGLDEIEAVGAEA